MAKTGRPTIYNDKTAKEICRRLALGESLRSICKDDAMPHISTVVDWAMNKDHEFSEQYATARKIQAEVLVDEIFDIADDGSNDWMSRNGKDEDEAWQFNGEHYQRSRLRLDTRKWYASKVIPRLKDKQEIEHVHMTHEEWLSNLE